jgi:hypothetical protein
MTTGLWRIPSKMVGVDPRQQFELEKKPEIPGVSGPVLLRVNTLNHYKEKNKYIKN